MIDISRLLLQREHFPIRVLNGHIREIVIPPYHPSMREGIDVGLAVTALDEALEGMIQDLEALASVGADYSSALKKLAKVNGKFDYGEPTNVQDGKQIIPFPVVGSLYMGKKSMEVNGPGGQPAISIYPKMAATFFNIPENVAFAQEIMDEYQMQDRGPISASLRRVSCPNLWFPHNVPNIERILFKNLAISIDNTAVKAKYSA